MEKEQEVDKEQLLRNWLQTEAEFEDDGGKKTRTKLIDLFFDLRFKKYIITDFLQLDKPTMKKKQYDFFNGKLTPGDEFKRHEQKKFQALFSKIVELNDDTMSALIFYYMTHYTWNIFTPEEYRGGRKLSRRRKSNPKSKSKHNKRRRSFKKSSYRRQRL
jgi:hypothetical protein